MTIKYDSSKKTQPARSWNAANICTNYVYTIPAPRDEGPILKCTPIKQRQYKPDWKCTIHPLTQNVTTTSSTDNTTAHHKQTTTRPLTNNNQPKDKNIVILQININGIRNKIEELKNLVHITQPDIITLQESKLTQKAKTPKITHYTTMRTDRQHKQGEWLITLIKDDITFTNINIPKAVNTHTTQN